MDKNFRNQVTIKKLTEIMLHIPAWLFSVLVLGIIVATALGINIPGYLLIMIVVILGLLGIYQKRPRSTFTNQIELSDESSPEYKIIISDFQDNIVPALLPLTIEQREALKKIDKDGPKEIFSIAGNVVFNSTGIQEKDKKANYVTSFTSPVKLTFNYTEADEQKFLARQQELLAKKTILSADESKLIPVYLYEYPMENPTFRIWKPFQNFTIDYEKRTITIEVYFWGDQNIGVGTKP